MSEAQRTFGKYAISIGTSVALESLFGELDSQRHVSAPFKNYQCVVINIRTLIRNYLSSYKAIDLINLTKPQIANGVIKEAILISNIIADRTRGSLKLSVYNIKHDMIHYKLRKIIIKKKHTAKQQYALDMETSVAEKFFLEYKLLSDYFNLEFTSSEIKHGGRRNIFITHYPVDLLFTNLNPDLLESHTGRIKKPYEFNTKLRRAASNAPFNKYTLQIYGDSSGYILPYSAAMYNELNDILKNNSYISPVTHDIKFVKAVRATASSELKNLLKIM